MAQVIAATLITAGVHTAIDLDDEGGLVRIEVDDERPDGVLAPELHAELSAAYSLPEQRLARRGIAAHGTRARKKELAELAIGSKRGAGVGVGHAPPSGRSMTALEDRFARTT